MQQNWYQGRLGRTLQILFPDYDIKENARKVAGVLVDRKILELDFWIPALRIAFEYQDPYHYHCGTWHATRLAKVQRSDGAKRLAVTTRHETLVVVPCWWDGQVESLIATIKNIRPDLLRRHATTSPPIPTFPPASFFRDYQLPGVGELMLPSFFATDSNSDSECDGDDAYRFDLVGHWWLSEKYDGFRACWNPKNKILYSRFGRQIYLHDHFTKLLSDQFLDGELWFGRKTFLELQQAVVAQDRTSNNVAWHQLRMNVFDSPSSVLQCTPIEKRLQVIAQHVPVDHPFVIPITNMAIKEQNLDSWDRLNSAQVSQQYQQLFAHVLRDNGEGIVLRAPNSLYLPGRSRLWWKLKAARDQEALVLAIVSPSNTNTGLVGNVPGNNYVLLLPSGATCTAVEAPSRLCKSQPDNGLTMQSTLNSDHAKLRQGDVVTFSYSNATSTAVASASYNALSVHHSIIPSKCYILHKRCDLSWRDVLFLHNKSTPLPQRIGWTAQDKKRKPPGFWNVQEPRPVDSTSENITTITNSYANSVIRHTLKDIKPDGTTPDGVNYNHNNVRHFFDLFAFARNLDGKVPESWFQFTKRDILEEKGGASILRRHSSSLRLALAIAYPESIGLVVDDVAFRLGFRKLPAKFWETNSNRKQFLQGIAVRMQLDPNANDTWRKISEEDIKKERGGSSFLQYCTQQRKSLYLAARECFFGQSHALEMQHDQYPRQKEINWLDAKNAQETRVAGDRKYIEGVAVSLGFDSRVASDWYANFPLVNAFVLSEEHGIQIASQYAGSVCRALVALLPDLHLVYGSLVSSLNEHEKQGQIQHKKREFFEKVSRKQCFDPLNPENWYSISRETIYSVKGGNSILAGSITIAKTLQEAFPEIHFLEAKFLEV